MEPENKHPGHSHDGVAGKMGAEWTSMGVSLRGGVVW